jgi:hypothetical protein
MSPEAGVGSAVVEQRLTRYWIELDLPDGHEPPPGTRLGIGVTALDRDDALRLVAERVFQAEEVPPLKLLREDVDVSTLDQGHVAPNMALPNWRGIWFPRGYD